MNKEDGKCRDIHSDVRIYHAGLSGEYSEFAEFKEIDTEL